MEIKEIRKWKSIESFQITLQESSLENYLLLRFQAKERISMLKPFFKIIETNYRKQNEMQSKQDVISLNLQVFPEFTGIFAVASL